MISALLSTQYSLIERTKAWLLDTPTQTELELVQKLYCVDLNSYTQEDFVDSDHHRFGSHHYHNMCIIFEKGKTIPTKGAKSI